jgi:hypothetical protein
MWPTRRNSPVQLAAYTVGGVFFYLAALLAVTALSAHPPQFVRPAGPLLWIAATFALLAPGIAVSMRANHLVREGIRLEWWSDNQVDALRAQIQTPIWTGLYWTGLIAVLSLVPFLVNVLIYQFWLPISLLGSLRTALVKPRRRERFTIDWSKFKPLQSEHWGIQSLPPKQ